MLLVLSGKRQQETIMYDGRNFGQRHQDEENVTRREKWLNQDGYLMQQERDSIEDVRQDISGYDSEDDNRGAVVGE